MMLAYWSFIGTAKAVLAGALPLPSAARHWNAPAGSEHLEPRNAANPVSVDTLPMSATASLGLAIRRSLPPKAAAKQFVQEMQSRELTGERTWRAIWEFYLWLCEEEELVPLPESMQARFAHELSKLCQRGQVRICEGGKVRRLTTYTIPDAPAAYLQVAA